MLLMVSSEFIVRKEEKHYLMVCNLVIKEKVIVNISLTVGASMAVTRGSLVTIGQIAFYEQAKQLLLATGYFKDNVITHFSSSIIAGK